MQPTVCVVATGNCATCADAMRGGQETGKGETTESPREYAAPKPKMRSAKAAHTVVKFPHPKRALARRAEAGQGDDKSVPHACTIYRQPPNAIPQGLSIITENVHELPRGGGRHIRVTATTCGLSSKAVAGKGVMTLRRSEQFCAVVQYDGQAAWPSYAIWRYEGQAGWPS